MILGLNDKADGTYTKGLVRVRMEDDPLMGVSSLDVVMKGWCDQQKKLVRNLPLVKETEDSVAGPAGTCCGGVNERSAEMPRYQQCKRRGHYINAQICRAWICNLCLCTGRVEVY
jgi:hypothetical protein